MLPSLKSRNYIDRDYPKKGGIFTFIQFELSEPAGDDLQSDIRDGEGRQVSRHLHWLLDGVVSVEEDAVEAPHLWPGDGDSGHLTPTDQKY